MITAQIICSTRLIVYYQVCHFNNRTTRNKSPLVTRRLLLPREDFLLNMDSIRILLVISRNSSWNEKIKNIHLSDLVMYQFTQLMYIEVTISNIFFYTAMYNLELHVRHYIIITVVDWWLILLFNAIYYIVKFGENSIWKKWKTIGLNGNVHAYCIIKSNVYAMETTSKIIKACLQSHKEVIITNSNATTEFSYCYQKTFYRWKKFSFCYKKIGSKIIFILSQEDNFSSAVKLLLRKTVNCANFGAFETIKWKYGEGHN